MKTWLVGEFAPGEEGQWRAALATALPADQVLTDPSPVELQEIEVALVANPPAGTLAALPRLKLIQSLWAGVDRLLSDPTLPPNVPVSRMVDPAMTQAMAETALWAVTGLHRDFFGYAARQAAQQWQPLPQKRADEVSVTVLGLGTMGSTVAARLSLLGYRVHGWHAGAAAGGHRRTPLPLPAASGAAALPGLLSATDIVVNLLPLTPATRGLIDARFLSALPVGASLINLARGGHVVEADLLAALDSGRLAHAVLDVFEQEPLPGGHPFWHHPRVTVLPHIAAQTDPRSAAQVAAQNVDALRHGRPLAHLVDRQRGY